MEALRDVLGCGHGWAEERARIALEITEQYGHQAISRDEYVELLEDLIRTDQLDAEANDVAVKGMLVTGIMGLISVA
jgi:hypothetical protein